jgi:hypothetical protein
MAIGCRVGVALGEAVKVALGAGVKVALGTGEGVPVGTGRAVCEALGTAATAAGSPPARAPSAAHAASSRETSKSRKSDLVFISVKIYLNYLRKAIGKQGRTGGSQQFYFTGRLMN